MIRGSKNPRSAERRLSEIISRTTRVGDCWRWDGSLLLGRNDSVGYGQASYNGTLWLAHRLSFYLTTGIHPGKLFVMHTCDYSRCINPAHLKLGTHGDNMRDASSKGRLHGQQKTHCPRGHEFTKENTIRAKSGSGHIGRSCRKCAYQSSKKYRASADEIRRERNKDKCRRYRRRLKIARDALK